MSPSAVCQRWRRLACEVHLFDTGASRPSTKPIPQRGMLPPPPHPHLQPIPHLQPTATDCTVTHGDGDQHAGGSDTESKGQMRQLLLSERVCVCVCALAHFLFACGVERLVKAWLLVAHSFATKLLQSFATKLLLAHTLQSYYTVLRIKLLTSRVGQDCMYLNCMTVRCLEATTAFRIKF